MRIIGGTRKGHKIIAPKGLPIRPTTDRTKEALFNLFSNRYDLHRSSALDLYAGSGNMAFEFASRGTKEIVAVDKHPLCVKFIRKEADRLGFDNLIAAKLSVKAFLHNDFRKYELIFADPPYDQRIDDVIELIFEQQLLYPEGTLVVEHENTVSYSDSPFFIENRAYGQSTVSIFEPVPKT